MKQPRYHQSIPSSPGIIPASLLVNMAKDGPSIPAWQKAAAADPKDATADTPADPSPPASSATASTPKSLPTFEFTEVKEMPPVPTRADAAKFLEHPGTKAASLEDKIAFLELKGVQRTDIEALVPDARAHFAAVGPSLFHSA
jgi:hypothetical protein